MLYTHWWSRNLNQDGAGAPPLATDFKLQFKCLLDGQGLCLLYFPNVALEARTLPWRLESPEPGARAGQDSLQAAAGHHPLGLASAHRRTPARDAARCPCVPGSGPPRLPTYLPQPPVASTSTSTTQHNTSHHITSHRCSISTAFTLYPLSSSCALTVRRTQSNQICARLTDPSALETPIRHYSS